VGFDRLLCLVQLLRVPHCLQSFFFGGARCIDKFLVLQCQLIELLLDLVVFVGPVFLKRKKKRTNRDERGQ